MLKSIKDFVFFRNVFGWKSAEKIHPVLGQKVRIYGTTGSATYVYYKDKIPNHNASHDEQRCHYCFEFEDKSIIRAKGLYWKEL